VGKAVEAAVTRFNQMDNGGVTVNAVFQGTFDQQLAKIRAAAAGGGLPQVATVRESDVAQFNSSALIVVLDPYVKDPDNGMTPQQLDDFYPGVMGRTRLPVYGNQTLSWPLGNTAAACFYNLDLLHRAGINDPPTTWDQVLAAAMAVKSSTGQPTWDFRADQAGPIFIDVLWTYGVPWLSSDGKSTNFDNPAALKVLQMFRQMLDDGTMVVSTTAEQDFPNGRGAMIWASSGNIVNYFNQIKTFEWTIELVPHNTGSEPITEMYGSVDTMFKGTPDQQLASWIFMK
jgi:ABC-type glycerol-3-phosphate transport system substrate-binding protein